MAELRPKVLDLARLGPGSPLHVLTGRTDRTRRDDPEGREQRAVIAWWDAHAAAFGCEPDELFHVPNGGHRSKRTAGELRRQGVRAGVPDLLLLVARRWMDDAAGVQDVETTHGLAIELKAPGGRPSPAQRAMLERLTMRGFRAVLAVGADAAIHAITGYLTPEPARP